MRFILSLLILLCAGMTTLAASPALAQQSRVKPLPENELLPVEAKLLYFRLLGQTPDYEEMIRSNPSFKNKNNFGQAALIAQQRSILEKLYAASGKDQYILVRKKIRVRMIDPQARTLSLEKIEADDGILLRMSGIEQYGIFIHNPDKLTSIQPPYDFDNFAGFDSDGLRGEALLNVKLVLKPLAASPQDFPVGKDGEKARVIVADIVALLVDKTGSNQPIMIKRFDTEPDNAGLPVPSVPPSAPNAVTDQKPLPPATDDSGAAPLPTTLSPQPVEDVLPPAAPQQ